MTDLVFGPCRLSLVQRRLFVLNQPIELGARSFDLLLALLERPGELVTKEDLLRRVWAGLAVAENTLHVYLSALRKALGPEGRLIRTVPGRGYCFAGEVGRAGQAVGPVDAQHDTPHNLPRQLTRLIGREADQAAIPALLARSRLVTLTGAGGVGKTRLALQVGADLYR